MKNLFISTKILLSLVIISLSSSLLISQNNDLYDVCTNFLEWRKADTYTPSNPKYHMDDFYLLVESTADFPGIYYYIIQLDNDDAIAYNFLLYYTDPDKGLTFRDYDIIELRLSNNTTLTLANNNDKERNNFFFTAFASRLIQNDQVVDVLKNYKVTNFTIRRSNRILTTSRVTAGDANLFNFHCQCAYFFRKQLNLH